MLLLCSFGAVFMLLRRCFGAALAVVCKGHKYQKM